MKWHFSNRIVVEVCIDYKFKGVGGWGAEVKLIIRFSSNAACGQVSEKAWRVSLLPTQRSLNQDETSQHQVDQNCAQFSHSMT